MAIGVSAPPSTQHFSNQKTDIRAMSIATMLFFMWGFLTCLNDILIPHLKGIFDLNYAQVMMVQFCFFSSYFIFAFPAGKLVEWRGYKGTMVIGLAGDGDRRVSIFAGFDCGVVRVISYGAGDTCGRNYDAAGGGESLCGEPGASGDVCRAT